MRMFAVEGERQREVQIPDRMKTMFEKILWWFELAITIAMEKGGMEVVKRWPLWASRRFYYTALLCERSVTVDVAPLDEVDYRPNVEGISLKVIWSNEEADRLEAEGFEFRSCHTHDNRLLRTYRERLDHGAIAFCIYAEHELAQITWIGPTQKAKDYLTKHRINVDFARNEVFATGSWTNPKYKKKGLYKYNILFNRDPFLLGQGVTMTKSILGGWHPVGYVVHPAHFGSRPYVKLRFLRILCWKFWKQTPL